MQLATLGEFVYFPAIFPSCEGRAMGRAGQVPPPLPPPKPMGQPPQELGGAVRGVYRSTRKKMLANTRCFQFYKKTKTILKHFQSATLDEHNLSIPPRVKFGVAGSLVPPPPGGVENLEMV